VSFYSIEFTLDLLLKETKVHVSGIEVLSG